MPYHQEYLVGRNGIFYNKGKRGFETAFPAMPRNGGGFFKQVCRGACRKHSKNKQYNN